MKKLQFRLRTLLIAMLVVACALMVGVKWFDRVRAEFYAEREVARLIEGYGGTVSYTPVSFTPAGLTQVGPRIAEPGYFDRITSVRLPVKNPHRGKTKSELLPHLQSLKQFKVISISGSFIDDLYCDEPANSEDFRKELPGVRISLQLY